jgi:hypothetical protein
MKQKDWISYIKLFLGMSMIFPLEYFYWSLNFGNTLGLCIALTIHLSIFAIGVIMFNYLETDYCFKAAKKL